MLLTPVAAASPHRWTHDPHQDGPSGLKRAEMRTRAFRTVCAVSGGRVE